MKHPLPQKIWNSQKSYDDFIVFVSFLKVLQINTCFGMYVKISQKVYSLKIVANKHHGSPRVFL